MTSNWITYYTIYDLNDNAVGHHEQHALCKTHWGDLLQYTPPENFIISSYWYDEEDEFVDGEECSLKEFIDKLIENEADFNTSEDLFKPKSKKEIK